MPDVEQQACTPLPLTVDGFNQQAVLPYGCAVEHIQSAMQDFLQFIGFVNEQLYTQQIPRLETLLMPANFSSIVGEFVANRLPKYSAALVTFGT